MRTVRLTALAVVLVSLATACGGDGDDEGAGSTTTDRASATSTPAGDGATTLPGGATTTPGGATPTTAGSASATTAPPATSPGSGGATTTTGPPLVVKVTAAPSCVKPGGVMTFHIDMGEGGAALYYVRYSDGTPGPSDSELVDGTGKWTATEQIEAAATPGTAKVIVRASTPAGGGRTGQAEAQFKVAGSNGTCS